MLTAEQRAARRHYLGSSDAAAILGLDPFRGPRDVYWEKVGPEIPDQEKPEFELGNLLEAAICGYAARRLGVTLVHNEMRTHPDGIRCANFDALIPGRREAVEAKFAGRDDEWGDEGTDQVPERVMIQCQHQIDVADLERVWVPTLVSGFRAEFRLYCVTRHDELAAQIRDAEHRFWREHVERRQPPDGNPIPPVRFAKLLQRVPNRCAELGDDGLAAWAALEVAKARRKAAEDAADEAQSRLLMLLGDAEAGILPNGDIVTYLSQRSASRCDLTRLRALYPEAYDSLVTQGSHRTLRLKKGVKH